MRSLASTTGSNEILLLSKLITIRATFSCLPRSLPPSPSLCLFRAFVPQNKYSTRLPTRARALIPAIPAINRASRTRGVINNERSSRRKVTGEPKRGTRATRNGNVGGLVDRGEERSHPPQLLPKTYGSIGRVISCLLDRLYEPSRRL